MLIRSIGLFWKRDDAFWSSTARNGRLLGVPDGGKLLEPVNFRDQIGVYVLYADYDMVYVGSTGSNQYSLYRRLKTHTRKDLSDRWNRFSWFGVRRATKNGSLAAISEKVRPAVSEAIYHLEAVLIHAAEPPLNRQGGKFGDTVTRYLQYRDAKKLGPTPEQMIREIWESPEV